MKEKKFAQYIIQEILDKKFIIYTEDEAYDVFNELHYSTFKISTMTVVFDFPSKY
jgi:hypothetical protein